MLLFHDYYLSLYIKDLTIEQKLENKAQDAQWLVCTVMKVSQGVVEAEAGEKDGDEGLCVSR